MLHVKSLQPVACSGLPGNQPPNTKLILLKLRVWGCICVFTLSTELRVNIVLLIAQNFNTKSTGKTQLKKNTYTDFLRIQNVIVLAQTVNTSHLSSLHFCSMSGNFYYNMHVDMTIRLTNVD